MDLHAPDDWRPWAAERSRELKTAFEFLTRIPLARAATGGEIVPADLAQASWAFPIAGIAVGVIGAIVYTLAHKFGLPAWPAAALAVAATMAVTGALHEDGLADTVDGFGGGTTRQAKLDIMRDARVGAFGVCALVLSILIRAGALASLTDPGLVMWALIAAHGGGRAAMTAVMFFVPPARSDGLSFDAGKPSAVHALAAAILAVLILVICLGFGRALEAAIALAIVSALIARLSVSQIGGQTGDVLGAVEQAGEIVVLLVAAR
jgi:adenosylcobinamide-GDP ribazoletransferase